MAVSPPPSNTFFSFFLSNVRKRAACVLALFFFDAGVSSATLRGRVWLCYRWCYHFVYPGDSDPFFVLQRQSLFGRLSLPTHRRHTQSREKKCMLLVRLQCIIIPFLQNENRVRGVRLVISLFPCEPSLFIFRCCFFMFAYIQGYIYIYTITVISFILFLKTLQRHPLGP